MVRNGVATREKFSKVHQRVSSIKSRISLFQQRKKEKEK
jgi:hypothetical protein